MKNKQLKIITFWKQVGQDYIQTFKNIAGNFSILTTMILSVIFYSFFYPIAYQSQTAEQLPIVIVDKEQSVLTTQLITAISNSPNVSIIDISHNFEEAKYLVQTQNAAGSENTTTQWQ